MRNIVLESACNGRKPRGIGPNWRLPRQRLMRKMLEDRSVPRLLVAPTGYGKTALAIDYADEVFGFRSTYWIDCQSARFIRDLDANSLFPSFSSIPGPGSLAVFDDVPAMDDIRAQAFARVVERLVDEQWEVVVATVPASLDLSDYLAECVVVNARDLMVTKDEYALGLPSDPLSGPPLEVGAERRDMVPAMAWGKSDDVARFVEGMSEGLPSDVQLLMFTMLVLRTGMLSDTATVARSAKKGTLRFLRSYYPHLGIDGINETFDACEIAIDQVRKAFERSFDDMVSISIVSTMDALAVKLTGTLLRRRDYARACAVARELCSRTRREAWLETNAEMLLHVGEARSLVKVAESMPGGTRSWGNAVAVAVMCADAVMGSRSAAVAIGTELLARTRVLNWQRLLAALVVACWGAGDARSAAEEYVRSVAEGAPFSDAAEGTIARMTAQAMPYVLDAALMWRQSLAKACDLLEEVDFSVPDSRVALMVLTAMLDCAARQCAQDSSTEPDTDGVAARLCRLAERTLSVRMSRISCPDVSEALLVAAYQQCCLVLCRECMDMPEGRRNQALMLAASLRAQGREGDDGSEGASPVIVEQFRREGDRVVAVSSLVEPLRICLVGGLEVYIGDAPVDPAYFSRQKEKVLLAMLALSLGREVPRDRILETLWPDSAPKSAINNFYSLWSRLKKALTVGDGSCPYLVKQELSCMLDARYVSTDVEDLGAICDDFCYGAVNVDAWVSMYRTVQESYTDELLPSIMDNEYIAAMRSRYKNRLINALSYGSTRLSRIEEDVPALWFAQAAFDRDPEREDLHKVLMSAQIGCGRFDEAISTFHHLSGYLREELGTDPSPESQRLYERALLCCDNGSLAAASFG